MKTNTVIVPNNPQSSLELNFTEMFKINNILISFMLLISNFFKDKHILTYSLVLAGLLTTTILAPLLSAYPEFFGGWEYVIRTFFAFPMIYYIISRIIPFYIEEFYKDEAYIILFFLVDLLVVLCLTALTYIVWQMSLVVWFVWLIIRIFKHRD